MGTRWITGTIIIEILFLVQNIYASRVCTISNLLLSEVFILSVYDIVWSKADVEKEDKERLKFTLGNIIYYKIYTHTKKRFRYPQKDLFHSRCLTVTASAMV